MSRARERALVLVHGSLGRPKVWSPVVERLHLRPSDTVATPTSPGWGDRSGDAWAPKTLRDAADDIAGQVDAQGRSVVLVGYSVGAAHALEIALAQRWELEHLVLIEPNPIPVLYLTGQGELADAHTAVSEALRSAAAAGEPDAIAVGVDRVSGKGTWDTMPERARTTLRTMTQSFAADSQRTVCRRYELAELQAIRVPTVVAYGSATTVELRSISEALAKLVPAATLHTIEGADHNVLLSHPDGVAALLQRVLDGPGTHRP